MAGSADPIWKGLRPNRAVGVFKKHRDISTREFEARDFRMLVKSLYCVHTKWKAIGDCLEIPQARLDALEKKWRRNAVMGLIQVLDDWMKGDYEEEKLKPCWWSVVYVVADSIGGDNPAAARKIGEQWREYEKNSLSDLAKEGDSVELHTLDEKEKRDVINRLMSDAYLGEVKFKWFEIGVLLGVPTNRLECLIDEDDKLRHVIQEWLAQGDDGLNFPHLPPPTLQVLVDAVAHGVGGANKVLAKKLAEMKISPKKRKLSDEDVSSMASGYSTGICQESGEEPMIVESDGSEKKKLFEAKDRGIHAPQLKLHDEDDQISDLVVEPFSQSRRDEGYYKMDSLKHGVALIINNKKFKSHKERKGTDRDEENLVQTWLYLGYRVEVRRDCKKKEMMEIFNNIDRFLEESNLSTSSRVENDSFVCCILSHGKKGKIISADSVEVEIEDIERQTGKSEILISKPKLFFIQACQGEKYGTEPVPRVESDDAYTSQRADFYFCYATVGGDKSYRDIYKGSWFVTELCKVLCTYATCSSVGDMQLRLNTNVANNPEYKYRHKGDGKTYVQQTTSSNQLQKHVHFFCR